LRGDVTDDAVDVHEGDTNAISDRTAEELDTIGAADELEIAATAATLRLIAC
jgi:hypothetical protein